LQRRGICNLHPLPYSSSGTLAYRYYYDGNGNRVQKCNANPCISASTAGTPRSRSDSAAAQFTGDGINTLRVGQSQNNGIQYMFPIWMLNEGSDAPGQFQPGSNFPQWTYAGV